MGKFTLHLIILGGLLLVSCRKDESEVPNLTAQQVKYNNLQYMTLKVTNSDVAQSFHLHLSGQNNQMATCQISKSDLSIGGKEILCWLEAEELDLYFNGANFALEVPSGVCDYVAYTPYYFYQYQHGRTQYGTDGQDWIHYNAESCITCSLTGGLTLSSPFNSSTDTCFSSTYTASDFNHEEINGPNCDEGVVRTRFLDFNDPTAGGTGACVNDTSSLDQNEQTVTHLEGLRGNCINGVGASDIFDKNILNLPKVLLYAAIDGMEQGFEMESPLSLGHFSNLYLANYVQDCATGEYAYDVKTVIDYTETSTYNTSVTDVYAQNDALKLSNPFYTWTCYNKAQEVKGIIRLQIREWNVNFSPASDNIDKTNPTKMDLTGNEDLSYPQAFNDVIDWDDIKNTASCTTPSSSGFSFIGVGL